MMRELGLETKEEHYFDLVPWQSLAAMNHNFLLTERRRHYLRYAGGLTFFEVRMERLFCQDCEDGMIMESRDGQNTNLFTLHKHMQLHMYNLTDTIFLCPPLHCSRCFLASALHTSV